MGILLVISAVKFYIQALQSCGTAMVRPGSNF